MIFSKRFHFQFNAGSSLILSIRFTDNKMNACEWAIQLTTHRSVPAIASKGERDSHNFRRRPLRRLEGWKTIMAQRFSVKCLSSALGMNVGGNGVLHS